jgi:hypothetical protein
MVGDQSDGARRGLMHNSLDAADPGGSQAYINGPLRAELTLILQDRVRASGLDAGAAQVEADDADPDGQTLLI